jgi:hypothetical protein
MATQTDITRSARPATPARLARDLVGGLGGQFSAELGIDVDAGEAEVERWFLAATLFGTRISAQVAERTFRVLADAGLVRIAQARHVPSDELVTLLDEGGYARYDYRTAVRLLALSEVVGERYDARVAEIGQRHPSYPELRAALDTLPGWGPTTVQLFLRELRGVWPGAQPPLDGRAAFAVHHLGLARPHPAGADLVVLAELATESGLDLRDLEGGLVRLALAHHRSSGPCPGGHACRVLARMRPPAGRANRRAGRPS